MITIKEELLAFDNSKINLDDEILKYEHTLIEYVTYLKDIVLSFDFENDFSECLNVFQIISYILTTSEVRKRDKIYIYEELKEIREKIRLLILQKPGEISKTNANFSLLKKMVDQIESLLVASFYDMTPHYNGDGIKLMKYLLFEVKQYKLIEDILEQYPYMIRLTSLDGTKLITELVNYYIEEILYYTSDKELKTATDLVYYDKVLDLFLNNEKLELSFKERKELVGKVRYYRKNINDLEYNSLTKQKLIFWLNKLEEKLEFKTHQVTFNELCYMHDIEENFDEGILSEARRISKEIKLKSYPNYQDKTNEYIITIDGDNALELDDGISIEKLENGYYKLGIHIANPMGLVKTDSIIFDEALKRVTSIYTGKEPIYLFPKIISKDKSNLLGGKNRLATSYYLYINDFGRIEDYEFVESIVNVHNTTYSEVDSVLNSGICSDNKFMETVSLLALVTNKIGNNFHIDETYEMLNRTKSNPSNTNIITKSKSSKMVEICMMMANYIVPYHMHKHNLPCLYRNHVIDSEFIKKLSSISPKLHSSNENEVEKAIHYLETIYPKATPSTKALGHFGLGLPFYSHLTSPLRRGEDIIMKPFVLDPFYFHPVSDKEAEIIEDKLEGICTYLNKRYKIIDSFVNYKKDEIKSIDKVLKKS